MHVINIKFNNLIPFWVAYLGSVCNTNKGIIFLFRLNNGHVTIAPMLSRGWPRWSQIIMSFYHLHNYSVLHRVDIQFVKFGFLKQVRKCIQLFNLCDICIEENDSLFLKKTRRRNRTAKAFVAIPCRELYQMRRRFCE